MGIRHTVMRLEREAGELYQTLVLPDGTEVRYEPNEMLDAYGAYMSGEPHRLLPYILQADTRQGVVGMIKMLEEETSYGAWSKPHAATSSLSRC
jgi:hypothetical protein